MSVNTSSKRDASQMSGELATQPRSTTRSPARSRTKLCDRVDSASLALLPPPPPLSQGYSDFLDDTSDVASPAWIFDCEVVHKNPLVWDPVDGVTIEHWAHACLPCYLPLELVLRMLKFAGMLYNTEPDHENVRTSRVLLCRPVHEDFRFAGATSLVKQHLCRIAFERSRAPLHGVQQWKVKLKECVRDDRLYPGMDITRAEKIFRDIERACGLGNEFSAARSSDTLDDTALCKQCFKHVMSFQMLGLLRRTRKVAAIYWFMHIDWLLLLRGKMPTLRVRFNSPVLNWTEASASRMCVLDKYRYMLQCVTVEQKMVTETFVDGYTIPPMRFHYLSFDRRHYAERSAYAYDVSSSSPTRCEKRDSLEHRTFNATSCALTRSRRLGCTTSLR